MFTVLILLTFIITLTLAFALTVACLADIMDDELECDGSMDGKATSSA